MTHPYLDKSQSWCFALRRLMGYPDYAPAFHTLAFCASGPRDILQAVQLTQVAADLSRDMIHVAFALEAAEPLSVSLAVRQDIGIEWISNVRLYAASETAKIELLAANRRWFIGPRHVLTSAKLPPKHRRPKGEQIAMRRWRQAVATMEPFQLENSVWVRPGERFADAIPLEELRVAA